MPYLTLDDLRGMIPARHLLEALDDDNDGAEDAGIFDAVAAQAGEQIDGPLSGRFSVPFEAPLPALVSLAAKVFAAELIYKRRAVEDDKNPWTSQAKALRTTLADLGKNLSPAPTDFPGVAKPGAVMISEPARTYSAAGRLSV
jgi:phage gp36-like protein